MNVLDIWRNLPEALPYEGYTFRLAIRGAFVGYFLTDCHSRKKYKRLAFREGYWLEKGRCPVSSVGSDYLFKVLLWDDADTTFLQALKDLREFLTKNGIPVQAPDTTIQDTEFTELYPNRITAAVNCNY